MVWFECQAHGTDASETGRRQVLWALAGHTKKFTFHPKCNGKLPEGILARWGNLPFGFLKAHYGGRIQNGSEEAIW